MASREEHLAAGQQGRRMAAAFYVGPSYHLERPGGRIIDLYRARKRRVALTSRDKYAAIGEEGSRMVGARRAQTSC